MKTIKNVEIISYWILWLSSCSKKKEWFDFCLPCS